MKNMHQQLREFVAALNDGQPGNTDGTEQTFDFADIWICVGCIRFKWHTSLDAVELDVGVLYKCATRLGFRAVVGQCEGLTLELWPLEGGAA